MHCVAISIIFLSKRNENLDVLNLMHRPIVNVRRHSLDGLAVIVDAGVPLCFLFVSDVICKFQSADVRPSNNTRHSRLAQAWTPCSSIPMMVSANNSPVSHGSGLKPSQLRPPYPDLPNGPATGPRATWAPLPTNSSAMSCPRT
jgi:hypothetical protein